MACMRLHKILSQAGIASRRAAEKLMLQGRVTVNGKVADQLGMKADPEKDYIRVDKKPIAIVKTKQYYIGYKPQFMITSLKDPQNRLTIADMLQQNRIRGRLFPVGRLDWDAEGLILFTNDGELAHRIMHPSTHLPKIYLVKIMGFPTKETIQRLSSGVKIESNIKTLPARVSVKRITKHGAWLRMVLIEGRQNQIKKMLGKVGYRVVFIRRLGIGPLRLGQLQRGKVRALTAKERHKLLNSMDFA